MKRIICLIIAMCFISLISVPANAEEVNDSALDGVTFFPVDGVTDSEINPQVQISSNVHKYSFAYKFKKSVNARVNFNVKKNCTVQVKLSTTSAGGVDKIYYKIYTHSAFKTQYLKQIAFSTSQTETKSTSLKKGTYTFKVAKAKSASEKYHTVGSGWMKIIYK